MAGITPHCRPAEDDRLGSTKVPGPKSEPSKGRFDDAFAPAGQLWLMVSITRLRERAIAEAGRLEAAALPRLVARIFPRTVRAPAGTQRVK